MLHFATELKVITLLLYNQKLLCNNNFLESQIISGGSGCLICRWTGSKPWREWPHTHLGFGFQGLLSPSNLPPLASGTQMGYTQ